MTTTTRCTIIRADGHQCEGKHGHNGPHTAPAAKGYAVKHPATGKAIRVTVPTDDSGREMETAINALRAARPVLEALQAAHPLPTYDAADGHGHALRLVREALAALGEA